MIHTLKDLKAGKLKGLKKLKLAEGLTDFPKEIYDLADSLEILDLSDNHLSELPNDIILLKKLRIVFFENNKFTEFPSVLAQLPLLSMIGFKFNQIHTIPENAFPPLLRWLILTNNQIKKLPKSIGDCQFLQKFPVAGNLIEELPKEMANCHNLELLRISSNQLKVIPDWLFTLPKLSWIAFGGNPITNSIEVESTIKSYIWKDFKIKELLGQGASGMISKANWISENKEVAVKVFKGSVTSDGLPEDEMKASIAAGTHQNLIPILGKITAHPEQKNGLLMDLISSDFINLGNPPNLETCTRDVFSDKNFTLNEVIKIAKSMASVSLHLHNKGINHGDLYAHNILINQNSEILFGDFGAASFYDKNSQNIERVEVRAFGCLLEDLLNLVDESEVDNGLYNELKNLTALCLAADVKNRPIFSDILTKLDN
ncbi:protein kinase [Polaribacter reichenbachii]|uniref:Protein kinase n=1 Tax=Polaribacter reichenbachii TaxID=996801 RepID=A0A1B8U1I9_9FLAO|nr:leucine-rich repeat-containing protein kinase family protein [Polaribacter reichenbachii]APZ47294.1 protein kinase [Polaribacter reichenbachii]AUC17935.1 protein kinase [Polaribacter reichenbachii]OBY65740.1 protein kinase [Polaribacter reichenbachii]